MISCDKAALISNKSQYHEASLSDKFKLRLHILFCNACSSFSKRNNQLSRLFGRSKLYALSDAAKEELRQVIARRI